MKINKCLLCRKLHGNSRKCETLIPLFCFNVLLLMRINICIKFQNFLMMWEEDAAILLCNRKVWNSVDRDQTAPYL